MEYFDSSEYTDKDLKGSDQTTEQIIVQIWTIYSRFWVRKQLDSFYCLQLCYGSLNKKKSKVIVKSYYVQHHTKQDASDEKYAFIVEKVIAYVSGTLLWLLSFEYLWRSMKIKSSIISEKLLQDL